MNRDELEYAISQYMDGVLGPLELRAVEERLAQDAEARAILDEYRRLDAMMKQSSAVPEIAWNGLANQISKVISAEPLPVKTFRLGAVGWTGRLAIAAVLLMGISVAIYFISPSRDSATGMKGEQGIAIIHGPQIDQSTGPIVEQIQIGPALGTADRWRGAEEAIVRPSIVLIDQAASGQDNDLPIY